MGFILWRFAWIETQQMQICVWVGGGRLVIVVIVTRRRDYGRGDPGFDSRRRQGIFLSSKASGPGWGSPNPFFNGPGTTRNKWEGGRSVELIIPSSGGVKSEWRFASAAPYTLTEYTGKLLLMSVVNHCRYGRVGREGRSFA